MWAEKNAERCTRFCFTFFFFSLPKLGLSCHNGLQEVLFRWDFFYVFFCVKGGVVVSYYYFKYFFLFKLSHFQTYCLHCSCWFLKQGDSNHLSSLSFLPLCRLLSCTAGNSALFFFPQPICFSDVGLSQDHPDQRTLRRSILSRTCGSTTPETAGTVLLLQRQLVGHGGMGRFSIPLKQCNKHCLLPNV